jgi:hypothetical protein
VPISCASCAASWPSVARRTFEAASRRVSDSRRLSWASADVLLGQVVRRRLDLGGQSLVEGADLRVSLRQLPQHAVEALRQAPHLVDRVDRHAARKIALLDVAHGAREHLQRLADDLVGDEARHEVNTITNPIAKMIEICSSVLRKDSTGPSVQRMTSVAFHGPLRSTGSSMGRACASPAPSAFVNPSGWRLNGAKRVISGRSPRGAAIRLEGDEASRYT